MYNHPTMRLGVIGGGQLGRMLIAPARELGVAVNVLDPDPEAAAAEVADRFLVGSLTDPEALAELASWSDLLTYEIEHIDVSALQSLADRGVVIRPSARTLATIQDKLLQKRHLARHGIPVPEFLEMPSDDEPGSGADEGTHLSDAGKQIGYPCVAKARRGGYDGRGVVVCRDEAELRALPGPRLHWYLERYLADAAEPAMLVARGVRGELRLYQAFEMMFHPERNICDAVVLPAALPDVVQRRAAEIAVAAVESFETAGLFAVELFLTGDGEVLVNEIAPRPHNSGHLTIEACVTSQFEQHLRAVCGLPLGSTELLSPGAMVNLLAEGRSEGPVAITGLEEALAFERVRVHLYGKRRARPGRKMGHVTALGADTNSALEAARAAADSLWIGASECV